MYECRNKNSDLRILFVECTNNDSKKGTLAYPSGMNFSFVASKSDILSTFGVGLFDCALVHIDPSNKESMAQLYILIPLTIKHRTPLINMSTFNPIWIKTLMGMLGVQQHFIKLPCLHEIMDVIAKYQPLLTVQTGDTCYETN